MPEPKRTIRALEEAVASITRAARLDNGDAYDDGLEELDCDRDHCDDYSCHCTEPEGSHDIEDLVKDYLRQIRMGYTIEASLQDILEEMERSLND